MTPEERQKFKRQMKKRQGMRDQSRALDHKFKNLTPEQRQRFKRKMKNRSSDQRRQFQEKFRDRNR